MTHVFLVTSLQVIAKAELLNTSSTLTPPFGIAHSRPLKIDITDKVYTITSTEKHNICYFQANSCQPHDVCTQAGIRPKAASSLSRI